MQVQKYFKHSVTDHISEAMNQHVLAKTEGTYDSELVESCKFRLQDYFRQVLVAGQDILPKKFPFDKVEPARKRSEFDWHDGMQLLEFRNWIVDNLFPREKED